MKLKDGDIVRAIVDIGIQNISINDLGVIKDVSSQMNAYAVYFYVTKTTVWLAEWEVDLISPSLVPQSSVCAHEPIDVGFQHTKLVCKHCDKDMTDKNE